METKILRPSRYFALSGASTLDAGELSRVDAFEAEVEEYDASGGGKFRGDGWGACW